MKILKQNYWYMEFRNADQGTKSRGEKINFCLDWCASGIIVYIYCSKYYSFEVVIGSLC